MKGRKPLPAKVRALRASPDRRPYAVTVIDPALPAPIPPAWIDDAAKALWTRIVPELAATGIVTALDETLVAMYCQTYSLWRRAHRHLARFGAVIEGRRNPSATTANECAVQLRLMGAELGLSPAARSRFAVDPKAYQEDALERYLRLWNEATADPVRLQSDKAEHLAAANNPEDSRTGLVNGKG